MNAAADLGNDSIFYRCIECGADLMALDDDFSILVHPTASECGFFKKGEPFVCVSAGKRFRIPTVKLEEIP